MTRDEFNAFCGAMKATSHVIQWGNSDVWKVGDKLFAVCGWHDAGPAFTFKVGDIAFEVLGDAPGIRPAPYLASRGMKWLQVYDTGPLGKGELEGHIEESYRLVVEGMTKKKRAELGL